MFPIDYKKFLRALGNDKTPKLLKMVFDSKKGIGDQTNRKLMKEFCLYMLVGGMLQAVYEYITSNNFRKVDMVKRDIFDLYEDDFKKIDYTGRLAMLFEAIPSQLKTQKISKPRK